MTAILRYAGLAMLLLFALSVALVCGEAMCESCVHACCAKPGRIQRPRRLAARLLELVAAPVRTLAVSPVRYLRELLPDSGYLPFGHLAVVSLRI